MSTPELSVVCKKCGSEVSPYVTECPYCGTRLRKRAPKLERDDGDELRPQESLRERRARRARAPRGRPRPRLADRGAALRHDRRDRRAGDAGRGPAGGRLHLFDVGAIGHGVSSACELRPWRYFAAPFVYDHLGYLFVIGFALAIFLPTVERRIGVPVPALL